ncbi:MAG: ABC transporter substrate-binding protein [Draconibacterium sp.]|nr:ABC transporter substrate-binding protein [Draconibacterium sp.]
MEKTRVSIVSYLNSKPFLYGLNKSHVANIFEMSLDIPSKIATKLSYNLADVGLIPVAGLEDLNDYQIIGDYCIGAVGKVKTVVLVSDVPLAQIETVLMDYQSRSSVLLAKVLAKFYWKKEFNWENTCNDFQNKSIKGNTAGVIIGDRVFDIENKYKYSYDLSEEWFEFTGLPFVFAVWAATKNVSEGFKKDFNEALSFGISNISEISEIEQINYPNVNIHDYFVQNISFIFDENKKAGMNKFLELARKLELVEL